MIAPPASRGPHSSIAVPLKNVFLTARGHLLGIYISSSDIFSCLKKKQNKTNSLFKWTQKHINKQSETHNRNSCLRLSYIIKAACGELTASLYLSSICGITVKAPTEPSCGPWYMIQIFGDNWWNQHLQWISHKQSNVVLCEPDIFKFTVHPEKQLFFQFKSVKRVEIPVIACHFGKYVHLLSWQKLMS